MRVKGSHEPHTLEYEVIESGKTALVRFYENISPYEEQETETSPAMAGYIFDRYTISRPHTDTLKGQIEADLTMWREFAKQEELSALSADVRRKRTELLREIDWTQTIDAPVGAVSREALRLYRQELRDITERAEFPYITKWPECPIIEKDLPDPVDTAFDTLVGNGGADTNA